MLGSVANIAVPPPNWVTLTLPNAGQKCWARGLKLDNFSSVCPRKLFFLLICQFLDNSGSFLGLSMYNELSCFQFQELDVLGSNQHRTSTSFRSGKLIEIGRSIDKNWTTWKCFSAAERFNLPLFGALKLAILKELVNFEEKKNKSRSKICLNFNNSCTHFSVSKVICGIFLSFIYGVYKNIYFCLLSMPSLPVFNPLCS